ncbi:MAG: coproporphyrinogen dehydrogenase HemZ, partial [Oscillospiraceae bacterium]
SPAQPTGDRSGDYVLVRMEQRPETIDLSVTISFCGREETRAKTVSDLSEKEAVLPLALLLYDAARVLTGRELRWGVLTGIRPVKLFHHALHEGQSDAQIAARMRTSFAMRDDMIALALEIARAEAKINAKSRRNGFSLYVSIPFCPQRCSYCSFVSQTVERAGPLIPQYVELLCDELRRTGALAREFGLTLQSVYFGGGTPTTLTAEQLAALFDTIADSFDLSEVLEYTVEAGRPDTIDARRLSALKSAGVNRISVNPQTMNDEVLAGVGRNHTAADVERAFALARSMGFSSINMDLIAGLPGDTPDRFFNSLDRVLALRPENITVHTLTLKRASTLRGEADAMAHYARCDEVAQMVDGARTRIRAAGLSPYYLYRQKNSIGSLDNTGYSLPGHEGVYNVFIMDEIQTILAAGAGAVTKLCAPGNQIRRIFNFKFPYEYISRYEQVIARKEQVRGFYEEHPTKPEF